MRRIREQASSAEWTSRVRQQPCVDALQVKRVLALRQQAQSILVAELGQADRAVGAVLQTADGAVAEDGERVDERLLHARVVQVEELLELAMEHAHQRTVLEDSV